MKSHRQWSNNTLRHHGNRQRGEVNVLQQAGKKKKITRSSSQFEHFVKNTQLQKKDLDKLW